MCRDGILGCFAVSERPHVVLIISSVELHCCGGSLRGVTLLAFGSVKCLWMTLFLPMLVIFECALRVADFQRGAHFVMSLEFLM